MRGISSTVSWRGARLKLPLDPPENETTQALARSMRRGVETSDDPELAVQEQHLAAELTQRLRRQKV